MQEQTGCWAVVGTPSTFDQSRPQSLFLVWANGGGAGIGAEVPKCFRLQLFQEYGHLALTAWQRGLKSLVPQLALSSGSSA